jgi:hypothetical protein
VPLLLLKLTLTPLIVGGASIASRHWGASVGGWIVSLPLTSAPVILFLALDHGPAFASTAATGTLMGLAILAPWSLAFVWAGRRGPVAAVLGGTAAFVGLGLVANVLPDIPGLLVGAVAAAAVAVALRALPDGRGTRSGLPHPAWDLPARVILGTTIVVAITEVAPLLGAHLSGLIAAYPVYVSVLAVFTQLHEGPPGAVGVVRGLLTGLFGTIGFWAAVQPALTLVGTGPAFLVGLAVAFAIQTVAIRSIRAGLPVAA